MKVYCKRCHKFTFMKFDKDKKVVCAKCKLFIEENECPSCNKINNWSNTGFYCSMTCYYLVL